MAYVHVDIDLDEFETHELISEIAKRSRLRKKPELTRHDKKELMSSIEQFRVDIAISEGFPEVKTVEDQLKLEIILAAWKRYNAEELEQRLR